MWMGQPTAQEQSPQSASSSGGDPHPTLSAAGLPSAQASPPPSPALLSPGASSLCLSPLPSPRITAPDLLLCVLCVPAPPP